MTTSPLSLRPDYPGDKGDAVPRGASASPQAYRTYYYSPGRETPGPYGKYATQMLLHAMSSTNSSEFKGDLDEMLTQAEKFALDDAKKAMQAAERFLDGNLRAEGYRYRKEEEAPRLRGSQGESRYNPKAVATIKYTFAAPTEKWTEMRDEGEVWVRGVRDPFPLVPIAFLEGLRKPLGNAIGDLTKDYDDLQRDIDALVALPQPDADNLLADEFWDNLIEKKHMEHDECPRLFSIWSREPMDCFTDLRSLPLLYSSF